ncbi:MAG: fibronectin type III domain-containing protein [Tepidisphaeraceae bacterium]
MFFLTRLHVMAATVLVATLTVSIAAAAGSSDPANGAYGEFNQFCLDTFGGKHEPLTYALRGEQLKFLDDGAWQHVSEDSAAVAFETNLPSSAHVEYGTSTQYGTKSEAQERPFYIHVHYLKDLKPGTTYHYRFVATDERGNKITSPDQTLTASKPEKVVYLPDASAPPYKLDKANTTYVLKKDIVAPGTALSVTAPGVTIDLNGHTITYNNEKADKDPSVQKDFGALATEGVQGVRCGYATRGSTKLFNGTIRQGPGGGGYGSVPVLFRGVEIAGVTIDYHGSQVSGIDNECKDVHHNVIIDRGAELTNRHQGVQAIGVSGSVHHNLIKRARQRGVSAASGAKVNRNEIYVDSCTTNSFGVMFYKSRKCEAIENRIFGRGYLAIGIGTVSEGVGDISVARNLIHMQSHTPDKRWAEYGAQSGAYCVRVTWGGENIEYADNIMVSKGRDGGMVRGVWFCPTPKITNVSFRRNTIKVLAENEKSNKWGAIVISGENTPESQPGLFEANRIISNFCHVRLGEEYGTGVNARFVGNTFVREGDSPGYATVICGFGKFNNNGSVFLDSKFEGGAALDKVRWEGTGQNGFASGRINGGNDVIDKKYAPGKG